MDDLVHHGLLGAYRMRLLILLPRVSASRDHVNVAEQASPPPL